MKIVGPRIFLLAETHTHQAEVDKMIAIINEDHKGPEARDQAREKLAPDSEAIQDVLEVGDAFKSMAKVLEEQVVGSVGAVRAEGAVGSVSGSERLMEVAGRLCYKSFKAGVNPNVTKIREGNEKYLGNIIKQKHFSVFEHATVTIGFIGVTRVFTHEIVRHRAGTAFSQESLRYVAVEEIPIRIPEGLEGVSHFARDAIEHLEDVIKTLKKMLLPENANFTEKKRVTSLLRRLLPIGIATNIMVTANHRAWRHMIVLRTSEGAEEELRIMMDKVALLMKEKFPNAYQDMHKNDKGEWITDA